MVIVIVVSEGIYQGETLYPKECWCCSLQKACDIISAAASAAAAASRKTKVPLRVEDVYLDSDDDNESMLSHSYSSLSVCYVAFMSSGYK